ncbi:MAG: branched-chain amino acid ABC transporter permease [Chloroflexi bacterium]|nr:branched-chain amino acid ABC transporter permease [Chloroflexota bacterium]
MARDLLTPRGLALALLGVFLLVFPFIHEWPFFSRYVSEFRTFNLTMFAVWLLVVLGMNLLTGYSGQISLGHAAVVLVGAFTAGILADQYDVPMPLAIAAAAVFTGLVGGVVIGIPAVRLSGPYLAIATFALVITLPQILKLNAIDGWTNGALGIRIRELQPPAVVDGFLDGGQWLYYSTMSVAVAMTVLFWNLTHSRIGRAFIALRDSEIGAEQMGVNVPYYKALAFGISSFYAGLAGGLFFMVQAFVGPESLGFTESLLFLVAVVIGGLGTILGSVFGALFLTFQAEAIDRLGDAWSEARNLRGVIYGGLLIATVLLFPRGFAGFAHGLVRLRPADVREWLSAAWRARRERGEGAE